MTITSHRTAEVFLVNAVFRPRRIAEPAGVLFLAARAREAGYTVRVVEPGLEPAGDSRLGLDPSGVASLITGQLSPGRRSEGPGSSQPLVVGISSMSWQLQDALALARELRERGFRGLLVGGGHGPTLDPEAYLRPDSPLDAVVVGEGEEPFRELCDYARELARAGEQRGLVPIAGVLWRTPEGPRGEPPAPRLADLGRLPYMARDILERKLEVFGGFDVGASIVSGRGCFASCAYCSISAYLDRQPGPRFRQRPPEDIVGEMASIHERYGVERFNFEDDNFLLPGRAGAARAEAFARACSSLGFRPRFFVQTRPDQVTEETVRPLLEVGLEDINVGIEAVSPGDLELFNRGGTTEDAERCLAVLRALGFTPSTENRRPSFRVGYITFHPYSTLDSLERSLAFLRRHELSPKKLKVTLRLYPATPIGARAAADGLALPDGGFRFLNPEVEVFYEALSGWLELWTPVRERVRSAEKRALSMTPPRDPDGVLVRTRMDLDRLAHEVAWSLLEAAKSSDWATAVDRAAARARADLAAVAAGADYDQACALADEIGRPEAGVDGWR